MKEGKEETNTRGEKLFLKLEFFNSIARKDDQATFSVAGTNS
jgi:hypothetical protein